ncbi:hypothetical protein ABFC25_26615 [Klebsiella pneumoniae]|nr:hypothetical protein [Klebsiella pneumoniae]HBT3847053.1 hypothetical protein [Klebsiella pneumoniae]HBV3452325.1 hypothetical protein [Klebsiella pneumoniae]
MEKINDYVEHITQTPWLLINGMLFYNKPFLEVYEILPGAILQIFGISMLVFFVAFIISKIRVFFFIPIYFTLYCIF